MTALFLDDDLNRWEAVKPLFSNIGITATHVETADQAINALKNNSYDFIYLDHDLGGQIYVQSGKGTGYEVAEWIANNIPSTRSMIIVHTLNPVGGDNIQRVLPSAYRVPFSEVVKRLKRMLQ